MKEVEDGLAEGCMLVRTRIPPPPRSSNSLKLNINQGK